MTSLNGIYDEIVDKIATPKERLILLEILKGEGKPERVIKACLKALELFPDDINMRKLLAETYFEQGSIKLAEIELDKITKQISELSSIFKLKYELLMKENRIEEAANSLKVYLAHSRNDQDASQRLSELSPHPKEEGSILSTSTLAEIYYKQGELEEAIKIYKQIVKEFPDDEKSKIRLDELMEIKEPEQPEKSKKVKIKEKKLVLIEALERWLANIEKRMIINLSSQA